MGKRQLVIDWSKIPGACMPRRRLTLRPRADGIYLCPDVQCLHSGFKSKRGCRKHVDSKHRWIFYFNSRPNIGESIIKEARKSGVINKTTVKMPTFSVDSGFGKTFKDWLSSALGGGKSERESALSCKRAMKYLMYCSGCTQPCDELDTTYVDCCLGSAMMMVDFLKEIQSVWNVGYAGAFNYLKSISDMMDFRKSQGVTDQVLRSFAITEVYLRRGQRCLSRKKLTEWNRNFDLETLMAKNCWATMEEMEKVVPFHLFRFKSIIEKCHSACVDAVDVSATDLTFATRFITTYLFLNVKCSRPMTFQKLTLDMMKKAKEDNGYVDQRDFKTATSFFFDTLIFTEDALDLIYMYINHCRDLLHPKCDYVLVNNSGKMCMNLCHSMTIIVYEAIGKHINPTRYRQIIETASSDRLTVEEQSIISQDQKHNSNVAQVYYKKRLSREVATKGKQFMEKMAGEKRIETNNAVANVIADIKRSESSFGINIFSHTPSPPENDIDSVVNCGTKKTVARIDLDNNIIESEEEDTDIQRDGKNDESVAIAIKKDIDELPNQRRCAFTTSEDVQLSNGIKKFGRGRWAEILKDGSEVFHTTRTRDALRMRAQTQGFKRKYNC